MNGAHSIEFPGHLFFRPSIFSVGSKRCNILIRHENIFYFINFYHFPKMFLFAEINKYKYKINIEHHCLHPKRIGQS